MQHSHCVVRDQIKERRMKVRVGNELQNIFGRVLADVKDEALVDKQAGAGEVPKTAQCSHQ